MGVKVKKQMALRQLALLLPERRLNVCDTQLTASFAEKPMLSPQTLHSLTTTTTAF